jgi:hypothetical protein
MGGVCLSELSPYESIKYSDEECWRKYFVDDLGQLYKASSMMIAIREYLARKIGRPLQEVLNEDSLFKILLGGLKEDGSLSEDGLATFYSKLFGTGINNFDEFISRLKAGMPLQTAAMNLYGSIESSTSFLDIVNRIISSLKTIFNQLEGKGFIKFKAEEMTISNIDDPKEVCWRVKDFIQACLRISPNYNPQTFFITSLYRITRKYMKLVYPKLSDNETFNRIKELFGLSEIIIPDLPDENIKNEYTIWGFNKGSIGYEITVNLVNAIFDLTELDSIQKFFNVKSEREIYLERALDALRKAMQPTIWRDITRELWYMESNLLQDKLAIFRLPILMNVLRSFSASAYEGECWIDGIRLKKVGEDKTMLLTRFLDYMSPQLLLNIGFIDKKYDQRNWIRWEAVILG